MTPFIALFVGLGLLAIGIACYAGWWRSWATPRRGWFAPGFGCLYIGSGVILTALLLFAIDVLPSAIVTTGIVVATALILVGLIGFFWLPSFLLPAWFRSREAGAGRWSWGTRS